MIRKLIFDFNGVILNKNTHQMDLEMLALIKELHDLNVDLCLFSNTSKSTISCLDSKFDFLKYFEKSILAEETGLSKPSEMAFQNLLNMLGGSANDMVYIDDNRENIRQANKFGMKGILFINEARLRVKLIEIAENDN